MTRWTIRSAAAAALLVFALAPPAAAQGKGRGIGRGRNNRPPASQPPGGGGGGGGGAGGGGGEQGAPVPPDIPGTGIRHFGSWLDDATLLPPWKGWMSFGVGYWKSSFGHQWDAPSMDAGMGITNRLQFAVFAPISRVEYTDGSELRGLGDTYVTAKIGLIAPGEDDRSWGVAVIPILEVLSSGSVQEGDHKVNWGLPLTFEYRFSKARFYGAAGYFSRGAAFGAGAIEVPITEKVLTTASLSYSRSLDDDPLADALELSRNRVDLTGTVLYVLTPSVTVYTSVGRTVSRFDENASSLAITAGASGGFQGRRVRR